jgi:hypothetical protein
VGHRRPHFLGDPISAVLAGADGTVHAALDLGHFGPKLWHRDRDGTRHELATPAFPAEPRGRGRRSPCLVGCDSWTTLDARLPPIAVVRFAAT